MCLTISKKPQKKPTKDAYYYKVYNLWYKTTPEELEIFYRKRGGLVAESPYMNHSITLRKGRVIASDRKKTDLQEEEKEIQEVERGIHVLCSLSAALEEASSYTASVTVKVLCESKHFVAKGRFDHGVSSAVYTRITPIEIVGFKGKLWKCEK